MGFGKISFYIRRVEAYSDGEKGSASVEIAEVSREEVAPKASAPINIATTQIAAEAFQTTKIDLHFIQPDVQ